MIGLIALGSPPRSARASRITARSTIAGTPVKSCITTREGLNGISRCRASGEFQRPRAFRSSSVTANPSIWRSTASSSTLMQKGIRETLARPWRSNSSRL